jgi:lipopolysaccharide export system protein LptC
MLGRSGFWFLLLLLAMLAALTMWASTAVQPIAPKKDGSSRHDPDYMMSNFHTLKSDADGDPRYMLAATEMVHYPDDDSTHLTRPHFTQFVNGLAYTQTESQEGLVSSNGEEVYLTKKVKVVRAATAEKGEMTVLTEFLHITPDDEIARTDRPVTILQAPASEAHAIGMEYNKKIGQVTLKKQARIHYLPPPHAQIKPKPAPAPAAATQKKVEKSAIRSAPAKKPAPGPTKTRTRRHYEKPAKQP